MKTGYCSLDAYFFQLLIFLILYHTCPVSGPGRTRALQSTLSYLYCWAVPWPLRSVRTPLFSDGPCTMCTIWPGLERWGMCAQWGANIGRWDRGRGELLQHRMGFQGLLAITVELRPVSSECQGCSTKSSSF